MSKIIDISSDDSSPDGNAVIIPTTSKVPKHIPLIIIDDSSDDDEPIDLPDWNTLQVIDLDINNAVKHSVPLKRLDPIVAPIEVDVSFGLKSHEPSDSSSDESTSSLQWDINYYERQLNNTRLSAFMHDFYQEKLEQAQKKFDDSRVSVKCIKLAICKKKKNKLNKKIKKAIVKKLKM